MIVYPQRKLNLFRSSNEGWRLFAGLMLIPPNTHHGAIAMIRKLGVSFSDFWRILYQLSFSLGNRGILQLVITDLSGNGVLSSFPLKLTFLYIILIWHEGSNYHTMGCRFVVKCLTHGHYFLWTNACFNKMEMSFQIESQSSKKCYKPQTDYFKDPSDLNLYISMW